MYRYHFFTRYPFFIALFMLLLLMVSGYHFALAIASGYVDEHILMLSLNVLISTLAITFLVLVYRRRALLTSPVELTDSHIHALVIGKRTAFTLQGEYQAVPWPDITAVRNFEPMSTQGRELGDHTGIELVTRVGVIWVWSNISGYDDLYKAIIAKAPLDQH